MEVLNSPAAVSSPYPRAEHNATEVRGFRFQVSGFNLLCYLVTLLLCYFEKLPWEGVRARAASQKTCHCRATARSYALDRREGEKQYWQIGGK